VVAGAVVGGLLSGMALGLFWGTPGMRSGAAATMPERRRKRHDVSTDPVRWREARLPSPKAWPAAYDGERPHATWIPTREVHAVGHEPSRTQGRCHTAQSSPPTETTVLMCPVTPSGGRARLPDREEYRR
jgi:hypothetical protein